MENSIEITIKELTLDSNTAIKIMKCIKEHEPEIWDVLRYELIIKAKEYGNI